MTTRILSNGVKLKALKMRWRGGKTERPCKSKCIRKEYVLCKFTLLSCSSRNRQIPLTYSLPNSLQSNEHQPGSARVERSGWGGMESAHLSEFEEPMAC